jgi:epoxide hydrolase 4
MGLTRPDRLERLALLNIPHPAVMRRSLLKNSRQRKKSSYMFYFQLPWLPERTFRRNDYAFSVAALQKTSRPGTFSETDIALYKEAWSQPGAVTSMIHWYRAALRSQPARPASIRVPVPTLLIWGTRDRFLGREMAQPSIDLCDHGRLVFLDEATHWVHHEEPARVNALLTGFFR